MSGLDQIFLGVGLVGALLIVKVVSEGIRDINGINQKLAALRNATEQCMEKAEEEDLQARKVEALVEDLKEEVKRIETKEENLDKKIHRKNKEQERRTRTRFRVDLMGPTSS